MVKFLEKNIKIRQKEIYDLNRPVSMKAIEMVTKDIIHQT